MQNKYLIPLFLFIIGLSGCGGDQNKKKSSVKKTSHKTSSKPMRESKNMKVSFFDEDMSAFTDDRIEPVEPFLLENDSVEPAPCDDTSATLAWEEPTTQQVAQPQVVYFDYDSCNPRDDQKLALAEAKNTVQEWVKQGYEISFKGHACRYHGCAEHNRALSNNRAHYLANQLCKELDVPSDKIHCFGVGNDEPIVLSDTQEGNAPNRRVEIFPVAPAA